MTGQTITQLPSIGLSKDGVTPSGLVAAQRMSALPVAGRTVDIDKPIAQAIEEVVADVLSAAKVTTKPAVHSIGPIGQGLDSNGAAGDGQFPKPVQSSPEALVQNKDVQLSSATTSSDAGEAAKTAVVAESKTTAQASASAVQGAVQTTLPTAGSVDLNGLNGAQITVQGHFTGGATAAANTLLASPVASPMAHTPVADAQMAETLRRVSKAIFDANKAGEARGVVDIRLDPPELGSMRMEMRFEGQRLHVSAWTSDAAAAPIMQSQIAELRQALSAEGIRMESFQVALDHGNASQQRGQQGERQEAQGQGDGWSQNGDGSVGAVRSVSRKRQGQLDVVA